MQRPAAPLLLQPHDSDVGQLGGQFCRDPGRVVDAGVVGDRDARLEREILPKMAVQPVNRIGEGRLLVVHRHHDVEHRHARGARREGSVRPRFEVDSVSQACVGFEGDVCHEVHG